MNTLACTLLAFAALNFSRSADALCIYKGALYAKTTILQEFNDSRWVVRAKVLSATSGSAADAPWTIYDLEVEHAYKGTPPARLRFFTFRDSGGFFMDRPLQGPDIGGLYLLFLNPDSRDGMPALAAGAAFLDYNCGQSGPWAQVSPSSKQVLATLTQRQ